MIKIFYMTGSILKAYKSNSNRLLIKNSITLMLLQIVNFILPLINVPYLLTTLGPEKYGTVTFALSFASLFQIITDYGFNYSATRDISVAKNDKEINNIFSSVIICKSILCFVCLIVGSLIVLNVSIFRNEPDIYLICLLNVVPNVLTSSWVFQGKQKMQYITFINVSCKILTTIAIFIFIKFQGDYYKYLIIYLLSSMMVGIIGQIVIILKLKIKLVFVPFDDIRKEYVSGWYIFVTYFLSSILSDAGIFILGIVQDKEAVSYFAASDKVVRALSMIFRPITQALFPQVSEKFGRSFLSGYLYLKKVLKVLIIPLAFVCICFAISSNFIFHLLYDSTYWRYSLIMSIECIWMFLSILNNLLGIQMLVGSGHDKEYSRSFIVASIISLIGYALLGNMISLYGIVISMLISEAILMVELVLNIRKVKSLKMTLGRSNT